MEIIDTESPTLKARRMVMEYNYKFLSQWPRRIFVWAWFRMPRSQGIKYNGGHVIDYYKKLANKKEYFALLEELGFKKNSDDLSL